MEKPCTEQIKIEYPRIHNIITSIWGTQECRDYMSKLVIQDRKCKREGFPFHIITTLSNWMAYHDFMYPRYDVSRNDPWSAGYNKNDIFTSM